MDNSIFYDFSKKNSELKGLEAQSLYCPKCKRDQPVIKKLLLVLTNETRYDYCCAKCLTSLGTKIEEGSDIPSFIITK